MKAINFVRTVFKKQEQGSKRLGNDVHIWVSKSGTDGLGSASVAQYITMPVFVSESRDREQASADELDGLGICSPCVADDKILHKHDKLDQATRLQNNASARSY
jgi:hypothetical protein